MVCNSIPNKTPNTVSDPNFIVVPTGGCWANGNYAEIINRTVITKSIVAIDVGDDTGKSLSNYITEGASVLVDNGQSNDKLTAILEKLKVCIINNNGVISPYDPVVSVYVIDANTQVTIAHSKAPTSLIPVDFSNKFSIVNNTNSLVLYENLLSLPSTWYEFVAPDTLDPTHQSFAYRFVSYASEYYRLVIHIRLTPVPILYPCAVLEGDDVESSSELCEDECNTLCFNDNWCPA